MEGILLDVHAAAEDMKSWDGPVAVCQIVIS